MAVALSYLTEMLPQIDSGILDAFSREGVVKEFPKGSEILQEGQSVKLIPIVLKGLLKVCTRNEDKELLLYFIEPSESCVMSFMAGMKNVPSKVFASAEQNTTLLLLPTNKVMLWTQQFPQFNYLFFDLYNTRYSELVSTLTDLLFQKLDKRLLDYLTERSRVGNTTALNLRHREIAQDLGTSREVISRLLKKLEKEGRIKQSEKGIILT